MWAWLGGTPYVPVGLGAFLKGGHIVAESAAPGPPWVAIPALPLTGCRHSTSYSISLSLSFHIYKMGMKRPQIIISVISL